MILGLTCRGTKVVVLVRKDLVDSVALVVASLRVVVVEGGGCSVAGLYGRCGAAVHAMREWLH